MRKPLALFVTLSLMLLAFTAAGSAAGASSVYSPLSCAGQNVSHGLVTKSGQTLVYGGKPLVLRGFTFYPADDGGAAAWATTGFASYIDTKVFGAAAATGDNLYRPTDQFTGTTTLSWDNATVWANMDHLICGANAQGRFVLLDLSFMKKVLDAEGKSDLDAANWYPMIDAVATHYAAVSAIAAVSFLGEPAFPTTSAELTTLTTFYGNLLNRWYSHDPNHLLSVGGLTHLMYGLSGWWQAIDLLPHNNIVGFKTYSLHDEQYQPTVDAFAAAHSLVECDEEFGMPQYMGDATWSGQTYNGLQVSRADFYQWVYSHANSGGWAMTIFWNSASNLGATNYDVSPNTPAVWAVIRANAAPTVLPPPPTPSPQPSPTSVPPTPSPSPSPTPQQGVPCVELVNGVMTLGTCVGTFTPHA